MLSWQVVGANIGTQRYWSGYTDQFVGWVLISATPFYPFTGNNGYEVIDRGPINPWTGKRYDER